MRNKSITKAPKAKKESGLGSRSAHHKSSVQSSLSCESLLPMNESL